MKKIMNILTKTGGKFTMMKTESYYGFTNNCTPLQKGKKENQLEKAYAYNNKVFRFADLAVILLFETDYIPIKETITHGMINGRYGKEWGELSKPRIEYRIESEQSNRSYSINKTLFEYCNYILDTFKSVCDAENFAKAEVEEKEKTEAVAKAEEEKQRQAKENEEQMKRDHREWLMKERAAYTNTSIEKMCKDVFEYYYGKIDVQSYCDTVILAKDIENPLSRKVLIDRLHNSNKASIKIFELFTGIKLPKNQKDREEFLNLVHPEEYGMMKEFKPKGKAEPKGKTEKKLDKYYRYMPKSNSYVESYGEKIMYNGITFFVENLDPDNHYIINEATTGMLLASDNTLTSINKCKETIKHLCNTKDVKRAIDKCINQGYKSPLYEILNAGKQ